MGIVPVRVGLKYCGGCHLRYDRLGMLSEIQAQCPQDTIFEPVIEGKIYDYILVVNGCQAQCADTSKLESANGQFSLFQWAEPGKAVEMIRRLSRPSYVPVTGEIHNQNKK